MKKVPLIVKKRVFFCSAVIMLSMFLLFTFCTDDSGTGLNKNYYTLEIDKNPIIGGTVSRNPDEASYIGGTKVTVTAEAAEGYEFVSWSGASNSTESSLTITINTHTTLTANFIETEDICVGDNDNPCDENTLPSKFKVTFDTDGGIPASISPVVVDSGKTMGADFPEDPEKIDLAFDGWFDGTVKYDSSTVINKNVTLKANWSDMAKTVVTEFTVTFDTDGGTPATISPVKVDSGEVMGAKLPATPTKTDLAFGGWFDGVEQYDAATVITKNVVLKAKWLIIGDAAAPTINTMSGSSLAIPLGFYTTMDLTVYASVSDGGTLSYQWYSNTTASNSGGTIISGATGRTYNMPLPTTGTYYRYVVVTNTNNNVTGNKTAEITGWLISNTVVPPKDRHFNSDPAVKYSYFTDSRDGKNQTYLTVKIGNKTWMAENLNYATDQSACYDFDASYCSKYGRLYNWYQAMEMCPDGWRLPTEAEYVDLAAAAGNWDKLKSKTGWPHDEETNWNGTDDYGFSALPGGMGLWVWEDRGYGQQLYVDFFEGDSWGYWWNATETDADHARQHSIRIGQGYLPGNAPKKDALLSVRCLKDD